MARDDFNQLKAELTQLRKENRRLKQALRSRRNGRTAPLSPLPENLPPDKLLPLFREQSKRVGRLGQDLREIQQRMGAINRDMNILIPALEVQVTGWNNEIHRLNEAQNDTENTYAGVVRKLETRHKELKIRLESALQASEASREGLEEQVAALSETVAKYESQLSIDPPQSALPDIEPDPFTALSIFDV